MTRKIALKDEQLVASIQELYGSEITSGDLKGFCASRGLNYQTVTRRLEQYKTSRGRWNLEVTQERVEEIERSFQAPAALPSIEQNLIPDKDDTFVKFGNFGDIKKIIQSRIFYPAFITGLSGNGKNEAVKWDIKDNKLTIKFKAPDKSMIGVVTCDNFDLEDSSIGISNTTQLLKLLAITNGFTSILVKLLRLL